MRDRIDVPLASGVQGVLRARAISLVHLNVGWVVLLRLVDSLTRAGVVLCLSSQLVLLLQAAGGGFIHELLDLLQLGEQNVSA